MIFRCLNSNPEWKKQLTVGAVDCWFQVFNFTLLYLWDYGCWSSLEHETPQSSAKGSDMTAKNVSLCTLCFHVCSSVRLSLAFFFPLRDLRQASVTKLTLNGWKLQWCICSIAFSTEWIIFRCQYLVTFFWPILPIWVTN